MQSLDSGNILTVLKTMFSQPVSSSNNLRPNYFKWTYKIADTLSIFLEEWLLTC